MYLWFFRVAPSPEPSLQVRPPSSPAQTPTTASQLFLHSACFISESFSLIYQALATLGFFLFLTLVMLIPASGLLLGSSLCLEAPLLPKSPGTQSRHQKLPPATLSSPIPSTALRIYQAHPLTSSCVVFTVLVPSSSVLLVYVFLAYPTPTSACKPQAVRGCSSVAHHGTAAPTTMPGAQHMLIQWNVAERMNT